VSRRLPRLLAILVVWLGVGVACGDGADVDERDAGTEVEGSYDPDDLDEREENE